MIPVRLHKRPICLASVLMVPLLYLGAPNWLKLSGVTPCWAVLWLLPWALEDGPLSGICAGLFLGLWIDGLSLDGPTYIPTLMLLGFWWGRLGRRGPPIERSYNLGLLGWIGSFFVGLSIWVQIMFIEMNTPLDWIHSWGFYTLLAQSILTGIMAPIIGSWLLLLWRGKLSS